MIIFGTALMGISFNIFIIPNNISTGGFSGLSAIIHTLLLEINVNIPASVIYLILNVFLFIFAYKTLGKRFAILALIGILSFTLFMELTLLIDFTLNEDKLITTLYGGIIWGVGAGLVIRYNGSTGGTDMLASIIRSKTTKLSTGTIILLSDVFVLTLSCFAYGVSSLLYTILVLFIASFLTDVIIDGSNSVKAFYIITNKKEELAARIFKEIKRGATEIKTTGMYSHSDNSMILCLINKYRVAMLKRIVQEVDPEAFVFSTNVNEVIGKGFFTPQPKVKSTKKVTPAESEEVNKLVKPETIENIEDKK